MVEVKTQGDTIICTLEGVLDGTEHIDLPASSSNHKKIELVGKHIDSWNTDFVVTLFNALKHIPKDAVSYSQLPESMRWFQHR